MERAAVEFDAHGAGARRDNGAQALPSTQEVQ